MESDEWNSLNGIWWMKFAEGNKIVRKWDNQKQEPNRQCRMQRHDVTSFMWRDMTWHAETWRSIIHVLAILSHIATEANMLIRMAWNGSCSYLSIPDSWESELFRFVSAFGAVSSNKWTWATGARRGVSKGVEDGRRQPALWLVTPETAMRPFRGWPPAGCRRVGHSRPWRWFRQSWPPLACAPDMWPPFALRRRPVLFCGRKPENPADPDLNPDFDFAAFAPRRLTHFWKGTKIQFLSFVN
jgi:hypothetical protein